MQGGHAVLNPTQATWVVVGLDPCHLRDLQQWYSADRNLRNLR